MADLGIRVVLDRPGRSPLELTPLAESLRWATAAVGGFADAGFTLEGDRRRDLSVLGMVRASIGAQLLWEGQVEDTVLKLAEDGFKTEVSCFGLRRRLEQTSVKRIWVKRDIAWTPMTIQSGAQFYNGGSTNPVNLDPFGQPGWSSGQYDATDLTKFGLRMLNGEFFNWTDSWGRAAELLLPGTVLLSILGTQIGVTGQTNGKFIGNVGSSSDGVTWESTTLADANSGTVTFSHTLAANADRVRIGVAAVSGTPEQSPYRVDYINLRLLGAVATEDATGGLYGGTILRDLISLIPELTAGVIESGSDFTVDQMDRSVRDTALSVVEEVNGFYQREWGVWEDGRFDWIAHNLDEPQWLLTVADLAGLELTSSIDSLVKNVYLSYVEVPTFQSKEANAVSTDQRNPYVKNGRVKDAVISVPFVMTSSTSQQLATVLARLQGGYVPASGTATLSPASQITNAKGTRKPACMIRAGENIVIGDLPKTDTFAQGRDGETLFHVASCETNLEENKVTLTVESLDRRSDVLLARLAAATRTVGG